MSNQVLGLEFKSFEVHAVYDCHILVNSQCAVVPSSGTPHISEVDLPVPIPEIGDFDYCGILSW